ncbi:DMT family transporter [Egicoccus sp. AB-alg2]|uniref:DMT family transporter n=1 Tax=Egicoccus sp. AB-alg2 TaxID=3242693 RepID=UPI00359DF3BE
MSGRTTTANRAAAPTVALLLVTVLWGASFPVSKQLMLSMTVDDYLAWRFLIAAAAVVAVRPGVLRGLDRRTVVRGLVLGAIYATAQVPQHIGITLAPASVSGFLTGLYVVFTPVLVARWQRRPLTASTKAAAAVATLGLAVLSLRGFSLGLGEALCVLSAAIYAIHIAVLGIWATPRNASALATLQLISLAVVTSMLSLADGMAMPPTSAAWGQVLFLALGAGAVSMLAQTWAQARVPAARAAIVMASEPVWAAVISIGLFGEALTARILIGGALVFAGIHLAVARPTATTDGVGPPADRHDGPMADPSAQHPPLES